MKAEKRAPQEDVVGEESQVKRQKVAEDRAPEWREYVHTFHCDRGHWKFNKRLQIALLQHLYDVSSLRKRDFTAALHYLATMQGMAREHTLADARRLREELLQKERDGETLSKGQQKQVLRTKRVIQVLNRGTEGEASESVADKVEAQEKTTGKGTHGAQ